MRKEFVLSKRAKLLGVALLCALYLSSTADQLGEWNGDAALYILLGKSIAEDRGYEGPVLPGSYRHTKYPFLFPAILASVIRIFGVNFRAIRAEVALIAVAVIIAWYFYFREKKGEAAALGLSAAFALQPYSFSFVTRTLSETPYLLLTGISFWSFSRWKNRGKDIYFAISLACSVLGFFCRTAGIALLAAFIAAIVLDSELRSRKALRINAAIVAMFISLAAGAFWTGYVLLQPTPAVNYFQEMFQSMEYGTVLNPADILNRVGPNLWYYFSTLGINVVLGLEYESVSAIVLSSFLWGLVVLGMIERGRGLLEVFYPIISIIIIILWPNYMDFRFLYPLMPLLIMFGYQAIKLLSRSLKTQGSVFAYTAFAIFFAVSLAYTFLIAKAQHTANPYPSAGRMMFGYKIEKPVVDWAKTFYAFQPPKNIFAVGEFIVLNRIAAEILPRETVIASLKPSDTTLITGFRSVRLPVETDPEQALSYLESWTVEYLIVDRCSRETARSIVPLIRANPGHFEKIVGLPDKIAPAIYKFWP